MESAAKRKQSRINREVIDKDPEPEKPVGHIFRFLYGGSCRWFQVEWALQRHRQTNIEVKHRSCDRSEHPSTRQ
jgi:hypothetical protein